MKQLKVRWQILAVLTVLTVFFTFLFYKDNKYQTPPPYGKSGVITLSERDLDRTDPVFLIDGWLLTDDRVIDKPTYIGEFSNLQRSELSVSPHGKAVYRLTLRYDGAPRIVSAEFPRLASRYIISLDGQQFAAGTGSGSITFLLTPGDHALEVETVSKAGYYSGMYFPPALSAEENLRRIGSIQSLAYAVAFLLPFVLSLFTFFLWRTGGSLSRAFGWLCCCYALYIFRYFVSLFAVPAAQYWFLIEDVAMYGLCYCVVRLTVLASGEENGKAWRRIREIWPALSMALLLLCLLIPTLPAAVFVHGRLTDLYYMITFGTAAYYVLRGVKEQRWESRYTLTGCVVFGAGLVVNLFFSNRFEPIRFFWQFEWCGLMLVLLFGGMMVSRSRRILQENNALTNHLEEQVKKRTEEVEQLLEERKAFFSDMAHDLKAPVFATQSFIHAIRKSGVGVDRELQGYLDQAEAKQQEMARRLQGLSAINELDRIEGERVRISIREMLSEIYDTYHGEAEVRSVYLTVEPPDREAFLSAQPEKMEILFENLIYNALKATPPNGKITVSARIEGGKIRVTVEDTGCGIPAEELPLIFRRFYVGTGSSGTGTGLGLYIVHSIVTELGGTISASSVLGEGTKFIMEFPRDPA